MRALRLAIGQFSLEAATKIASRVREGGLYFQLKDNRFSIIKSNSQKTQEIKAQ